MPFKTGDRVFLMNSDEHGIILHFIDKDEVVIKIGNTQLEVFTAMLRPFTEQETIATPSDIWDNDVFNDVVFAKYAPEVLLCFVPVLNKEGDVEKFSYQIVNTLPFRILADTRLQVRLSHYVKDKIILGPGTASEAGLMSFSDLNDVPELLISAQAHDGALFETLIKLRAKSFFNKMMFNPILEKEAYTYVLFDWEKHNKPKAVEPPALGSPDIVTIKPKQPIPAFNLTPRYEVDLHIEKLTDEHMLLGKHEMLDIQLRVFEKELDSALHRRQRNIIFIHGVGKGVLRNEIIKLLDRHPHVHHHQYANFEKYGYGAVEVIFRL